MNKMWHEHTMDYNPALRRKGMLTQAPTWMNPEGIALSETSRSEGRYTTVSQKVTAGVRFIETESKPVVVREGVGAGGVV